MKGNSENKWCGVKCVCAGVEKNEKGREGVAILMSDLWYRAILDFVFVSTRILMVKFKFEKVKVCVVVTYGPYEGNVEESTIFWDNLNGDLNGVIRSFRLIVLGDLN